MENTRAEISNTSNPADQPNKETRQKPKRSFFPYLIIVLLLAALGWLSVQLQTIKQNINGVEKHINKVSQESNVQKTNDSSTFTQLTQQLAQQQNQLNQLNTQVTQLQQQQPRDENAWKVSEIIYLVRLANLQLTVQHSADAALQLLHQANDLLTELDDPALSEFQQAIAKNINDLQMLPPIDMLSISTQIDTLLDQVPNLSILVAPKPNTSVLQLTQHQEHKKWWQRAWDNIKASMQQLVVVRHQQELPVLMSPDQQAFLQENLQLKLMQAQWALMNQKNDLYQSSLRQAKSWVEKYYVQNSASTQDFLKQLQILAAINVAPSLPDLSQTLALANRE